MEPKAYFLHPASVPQRQYEALRAYFVEGRTAAQAAQQFGYTRSAFYSLVRDFKSNVTDGESEPFFATKQAGRNPKDPTGELQTLIISLRKKYLSVPDITSALQALGYELSEKYVYNVLTEDGFGRLPRRNIPAKKQAGSAVKLVAPKAHRLSFTPEKFTSQNTLGALCLLPYLVFDSRFTTYETLAKLDKDVKFITIRRRGKNIVEQLDQIPACEWKQVRVMKADGKGRLLRVHDSRVVLRGYGKEIRQIALTGHGRIKPALIITNDFERPLEEIVRMYARRWLVEKTISEQIEFFHLNSVSSSMVIKVDFDLTMSIFTHNILRLLAQDLPGYTHLTAQSLYDRFLNTSGAVEIGPGAITVRLKKKRNLPAILTAMAPFQGQPLSLLGDRTLRFEGDTRS